MGQEIGNSKTSSKQQNLQLAAEGDIPNRLKLLAFFCRQPRVVPLKAKNSSKLLEIDAAKEDELLWSSISKVEFDLIRSLYLSFVRQLRSSKVWATLPDYNSGISDLTAVDALEPIRATAKRTRLPKRDSNRLPDSSRPAKRIRSGSDSEASTVLDSCRTQSESERSDTENLLLMAASPLNQ